MGRNIVVCCDGTGNEYGSHNTNVVRVFEAIVRDAGQVGFYDPGVGTFSTLGRSAGKWAGKVLGKGFGWGLRQNIEDAYEYLMNHYEAGDRLYLFGFSRGAYTARSLAGMLHKCGLLQRGSRNLMSYASEIYNTSNNAVIADGFKEAFCQPCKPYFIGVWDTVASLGYFLGKRFFDADLHPETPYGYHALSIDEQRRKFLPSIWNEDNEVAGQIIEQVWFPGVHSDVGGSYQERGLSDGALQWLLTRAENAGLRLKPGWNANYRRDSTEPNAQHQSRTRWWKLWPKVHRTIPEGARIHRSAIDRRKAGIGYEPPNLPKRYEVEEED